MISNIDEEPQPTGELTLRLPALTKDTNAFGDISCGWLITQMDAAATAAAGKVASGRVITVAADDMSFLIPISVGSIVSCYTRVVNVGRSSLQVVVEAWLEDAEESIKATEGLFVLVALDEKGRTRSIASPS